MSASNVARFADLRNGSDPRINQARYNAIKGFTDQAATHAAKFGAFTKEAPKRILDGGPGSAERADEEAAGKKGGKKIVVPSGVIGSGVAGTDTAGSGAASIFPMPSGTDRGFH